MSLSASRKDFGSMDVTFHESEAFFKDPNLFN